MSFTPIDKMLRAAYLPLSTDELCQALFAYTPNAVLIATLQGRYFAVNEQACVLLGYTQAELLNLSWYDVVVDKDPTAKSRSFKHLQASETLYAERGVRCKNGSVRDVALSVHRVADTCCIIFLQDITAQNQVEHELQQKSATLAQVLLALGIPSNQQTNAASVPAYAHVQTKHVVSEIPARARKLRGHRFGAVRPSARMRQNKSRLVNSATTTSVILAQDVEHLRYQSTVLQQASEAIIATDLDFVITSWNHAAEVLYGWRADEAVGRLIDVLLKTVFTDSRSEKLVEQFFAYDHNWEGEVVQQRADGSALRILSSITALTDRNGKPVGTVLVNRDITLQRQAAADLSRLQEQHHQAQKLEGIGRLANGISQHFNNQLMLITGYSDLLREKFADNQELQSYVEQIWHAADQAALLTRQLQAFGKNQPLEPEVVDLNTIVTDLYPVLEQMLSTDITLVLDLQPDLASVAIDLGQIEQAIMHLVINACDAMPHGGTISITTRNVAPHIDGPHYPCVSLMLTDSGGGMDADTQSQIFEPFFTTKELGINTGLGLASIYGFIIQSGGSIQVDSQQDFGSRFTILLPVHIGSTTDTRVHGQALARGEAACMVGLDRSVGTELMHT